MRKKFRAIPVALAMAAAVGAFPLQVSANDAGLYDAPIPADKSLVRFLNVKLKGGVSLDISGRKFDVEAVVLSNYQIVDTGPFTISDGAASTDAKLEAGKFYTIAIGAEAIAGKSIVVIDDKAVENPSKSALSFYNFSTQAADLSLLLNGDSKVLFKDVPPAGAASKELPAIDIGLEVSGGDKKVTEVQNVSLTAKDRQNVVVVSTPNGPSGFLTATGIDR